MLVRLIVGAALLLGVAAPSALAQQADPQTRKAVEAIVTKWTEATNQGDGKTAMSFFAPDGFDISVYGKETPGPQMEETAKNVRNMGISLKSTIEEVKPLAGGQLVLATGTFEVAYTNNPTTKSARGNSLWLLEKQGSDWKVLAQSYTRQAPPAAATGSTTQTK